MDNIILQTFDGAPNGANIDVLPHELPPGFARQLRDVWVDTPGVISQRGPVKPFSSTVDTYTNTNNCIGMFQTTNPQGQLAIMVIISDGTTTSAKLYDSSFTGTASVGLTPSVGYSPIPLVASSSLMNGGLLIGLSNTDTETSTAQHLFLWRGATKNEYFHTGLTVTRGSATVTGVGTAFLANVTPGMFLKGPVIAAQTTGTDPSFTPLFGVVKSVNSDTSITLEDPALFTYDSAVAAASFKAIRGLNLRFDTGLITTSTTTPAIIGAGTKFKSQGWNDPAANELHVYRRSDMVFVGRVTSVTNDVTAAFAANAAVDMTDEEYVAINRRTFLDTRLDTQSHNLGFIPSFYAGRNWYANKAKAATTIDQYTNRIYFSSESDPEAVDISPQDGDFIQVVDPGSPIQLIRAALPIRNQLLIFGNKSVFGLRGLSPAQFSLAKIEEDGAISAPAIVPFKNGALWSGREGIYAYDGYDPVNLLEGRLKKWWSDSLLDFDSQACRAYAAVTKDKYLVHVEGLMYPNTVIRNSVTETPETASLVVNLTTRAVNWFTNLSFTSTVYIPNRPAPNHLFAVKGDKIYLCSFNAVFEERTGVDTVTCVGSTPGPKPFIETPQFSAGQLQQKKRWKLMLLNYAAGSPVNVDLVPSFNPDETAMGVVVFPTPPSLTWDSLAATYATWDALGAAVSTWSDLTPFEDEVIKRKKFLQRSQRLGLRMYPDTYPSTKFRIAEWSLGYKNYRPGRV